MSFPISLERRVMINLSFEAGSLFVLLAFSILLTRQSFKWKTLAVLVATMIVLAYGEPRWGKASATHAVDDATCWILLDVSRSMLCRDVGMSRLDRARRLAMSLVDTLPGKRIGVITFAGGANLACPPSWDHAFVREVIARLTIDDAPPGGSSIESAVKPINPSQQPAVVVFSDGEFTSPIEETCDALHSMKATVVVAGIGNPTVESPIPWETGFIEENGSPVLTRLDEKSLHAMAERTGGIYVPARDNDVDLASIVQAQLLPRWTVASEREEERANRYQWPLAGAIALALILTGRRWL